MKLDKIRDALVNARSLLIAFNGNPAIWSKQQAEDAGMDMIQWEMIRELDEAIEELKDGS